MIRILLVFQMICRDFCKGFFPLDMEINETAVTEEEGNLDMRELVKQLAERMKTLNHLLPILPEEELYVRFESETGTAVVVISKHRISPKAEVDERRVLTVRGSKEALESLLSGRMKLQQLIRLQEVHISGSFRHMLLLESLLHLAKPYRHVC
jgi:hypothetical protein